MEALVEKINTLTKGLSLDSDEAEARALLGDALVDRLLSVGCGKMRRQLRSIVLLDGSPVPLPEPEAYSAAMLWTGVTELVRLARDVEGA